MKEITRVLKNTQILKNDANNKKKKEKNSFFICPPLPIIIMTIYFYYYNIFWDFFSVPPFTFYTQEKNIVHKKEFEIPREKKSFILKREQTRKWNLRRKKYYYIHTHILHIKNWCYCVQ